MLNFLFETFRLGIKNLRLHKLRSLLTALGIIFGVAAVIIMVAIGEGTKQAALEQIQQLGARNILVRSIPPPQSTDVTASTSSIQYGLRRTDLERLETLPDIEIVVPLRDTEQKVIRGDIQAQANAIGTTPQIFDVVNLRLARGEYFTPLQYERGESVCVIGNMAARQLFPFEDPLGEEIRVGTSGRGTVVLKIIGVLEPTGLRAGSEGASMMQRDLDMDVYFPLTLSRRVFGDTTVKQSASSRERKTIELSEVWLKAKYIEDVERLSSIAENVVGLQQRNGRGGGSGSGLRNDVEIKAPIQILRNAERLNRMFNFIMVGIASFSLVVGGIGIMNIMLASVTERTREIGIRRALGAKRRHITLQFLIETTVISLTGGLIGIALGSGGATVLPPLVGYFSGQNYPTAIAAWSVIGSFVVSGCIGIVFGLYPAIMAAWMNPIEALRHE
jgi:putative ABC transport system permease protein